LIATQGDLVFGTIQENGATFITGNLATGQGTPLQDSGATSLKICDSYGLPAGLDSLPAEH
jgi:hypothetical protein